MTHSITIKIAPIVSVEHEPKPGRTLFYRDALRLLPGRDSVPLVIDHNMGRELGRIDKLFKLPWTDGPWIAASGWLDKPPPSWLRRGSPASFARWDAHAASDELGERVTRAFLKEITLCLATEPTEPNAQVMSLRPAEAKRKAREEEPTVIRRTHREPDFEIEELRRRLDWHEEHRTGVSFEEIIDGMRHELRRRHGAVLHAVA